MLGLETCQGLIYDVHNDLGDVCLLCQKLLRELRHAAALDEDLPRHCQWSRSIHPVAVYESHSVKLVTRSDRTMSSSYFFITLWQKMYIFCTIISLFWKFYDEGYACFLSICSFLPFFGNLQWRSLQKVLARISLPLAVCHLRESLLHSQHSAIVEFGFLLSSTSPL